jgi:hypothetical protein
MLKHKFTVGDYVRALPDANNPDMPPGDEMLDIRSTSRTMIAMPPS